MVGGVGAGAEAEVVVEEEKVGVGMLNTIPADAASFQKSGVLIILGGRGRGMGEEERRVVEERVTVDVAGS